jgi:hypothetical protein
MSFAGRRPPGITITCCKPASAGSRSSRHGQSNQPHPARL